MTENTTTYSLADLCVQHEFSLEKLVECCGLDESRVTSIILGRWTPSPQDRKAIADVFSLGIHEIKWGHATPIQHIYGHGPG